MILYRFSHRKYAHEISGNGARLKGGRWNPVGIPVVYTSESISLALLEILANTLTFDELQLLQLMEIHVPDSAGCHDIKLHSLKKDWHHDFDYTQWMGKEVLRSQRTLLCRCPSAIVPREHNLLINPLHRDYKKVKVEDVSEFYFDARIFRNSF